MSKKINLDATDYSILEILQMDASISNKDLSERIKLSPPATLVRVSNLIKAEYLSAPTYVVNWTKLKFNYKSVVLSIVHKEDLDLFTNFISNTPEIRKSSVIKRDTGISNDTDSSFMSLCIFKEQADMVSAWAKVIADAIHPIKFQVWAVGEDIYASKPLTIPRDLKVGI